MTFKYNSSNCPLPLLLPSTIDRLCPTIIVALTTSEGESGPVDETIYLIVIIAAKRLTL
jgi:hypothetical protein